MNFCNGKNIRFEAYSSLMKGQGLTDKSLLSIASGYKKSTA